MCECLLNKINGVCVNGSFLLRDTLGQFAFLSLVETIS